MKKMMLIVPALHQGGFEKVCVATARLLQPYFQIQIVIFDSREIAYDIRGLTVIDLHLASRPGKFAKLWNVLKRAHRIHRLKKEEGTDIAYSFGPTANIANIVSFGKAEKWLGIRSYMDMGNPRQIKWFCKKADRLICCSERICREVEEKYGCKKAVTLHNPFDLKEIELLAEKEKASLPWEEGRILVSMGREDTVKGFWHLLKSFALVHEALPDTKLMIIGQGEYAQYKELAAGLGIDDVVCFMGLKKNPYPYLKCSSLSECAGGGDGARRAGGRDGLHDRPAGNPGGKIRDSGAEYESGCRFFSAEYYGRGTTARGKDHCIVKGRRADDTLPGNGEEACRRLYSGKLYRQYTRLCRNAGRMTAKALRAW